MGTTTPWSIPSNQAIAYNKDEEYIIAKINSIESHQFLKNNEYILIAKKLLKNIEKEIKIELIEISKIKGHMLKNTLAVHPLHEMGYILKIPFLNSEHVNLESGSGLVHIAPDHGPDDFKLIEKNKLKILNLIKENGVFSDKTPIFKNKSLLKI